MVQAGWPAHCLSLLDCVLLTPVRVSKCRNAGYREKSSRPGLAGGRPVRCVGSRCLELANQGSMFPSVSAWGMGARPHNSERNSGRKPRKMLILRGLSFRAAGAAEQPSNGAITPARFRASHGGAVQGLLSLTELAARMPRCRTRPAKSPTPGFRGNTMRLTLPWAMLIGYMVLAILLTGYISGWPWLGLFGAVTGRCLLAPSSEDQGEATNADEDPQGPHFLRRRKAPTSTISFPRADERKGRPGSA
jgi:hypothetical protein